MIEKLKHSIEYIRNIGVHTGLSVDLMDKVRTINTIILIGIALNLLFLCLAIFIYQAPTRVTILIISVIFIEALVLVFNAILVPKIVFYYIIASWTLLFTILKVFYVNNWGEQFLFLIIIYVVFLLFNERKKQFYLVLTITLFYLSRSFSKLFENS